MSVLPGLEIPLLLRILGLAILGLAELNISIPFLGNTTYLWFVLLVLLVPLCVVLRVGVVGQNIASGRVVAGDTRGGFDDGIAAVAVVVGGENNDSDEDDSNSEDNDDHDSSPKNKCTRCSVLARTYTPLLM